MVVFSGPDKEEYRITCWNILDKLLEFLILQEGKVDNKNLRHLKKIPQYFQSTSYSELLHLTTKFLTVSFCPQIAAKQAAAAATQTIAASQNAAVSNKNTAAHQQLVQSCKVNLSQLNAVSRKSSMFLSFQAKIQSPCVKKLFCFGFMLHFTAYFLTNVRQMLLCSFQ